MTDQRDIDRKREELRLHLKELEDRVNPKKVANRAVGKAQDSYNEDPTPWLDRGASWVLTRIGPYDLDLDAVRRVVDAGP